VESPPERRQNLSDLTVRALQAKEPAIHWAALSLMPSLLIAEEADMQRDDVMKALDVRLGLTPLSSAPFSSALVLWLCRAALAGDPVTLLSSLQVLFTQARPDWKCGRSIALNFLKDEAWLPLPPPVMTRLLVAALTKLIHHIIHDPETTTKLLGEVAPWHLTAWLLLHDARPAQSQARAIEIEVLLETAATMRCAGLLSESTRLTSLALHLLPERAPAPLVQRCRVAAWTLAEAGLAMPAGLRVALDDLPFPGEPVPTEKGQEATRLFRDEEDVFQAKLMREVVTDPDWQRLKAAGVVLHHPLAALAWIGKKAQSYALKKQHELLQAATRLAFKHQCFNTLGRILAEWPETAENVIAFANALRQNQRRMPVLRDDESWRTSASHLRAAWGKLEPEAIRDEETLFLLHETLLDRDVTLLRCLPEELRLLALRHLHGRRQPSPLVLALEAEPRLMQSLEHQRMVELWSISADMRERPELANSVWISIVMKGEWATGKYSWIMQSAGGRLMKQSRLRASAGQAADVTFLAQELADAVSQLSSTAECIVLTADSILLEQDLADVLSKLLSGMSLTRVPSWEWASRVSRESDKPKADLNFEVLCPEGRDASGVESATAPVGLLAQSCLLLAGKESCDAATRWTVVNTTAQPAETRRSLGVGAHPFILSEAPLKQGNLKADLARLSLAQSSRIVLAPHRSLTPAEHETFSQALFSAPPDTLIFARLQRLRLAQPGLWRFTGIVG